MKKLDDSRRSGISDQQQCLCCRSHRRQLEDGKRRDRSDCQMRLCLLRDAEDRKNMRASRSAKMTGSGDNYAGEITDPANDKTYSGSGTVSGKLSEHEGVAC